MLDKRSVFNIKQQFVSTLNRVNKQMLKLSEPGYFSCLLDKSQNVEEEVGSYHGDESEEEEEPSMLSKSQHFKAGALTTTNQGTGRNIYTSH